MGRGPAKLRYRQRVGFEGKAHGNVGCKWQVAAGSHLHLVPAELAEVGAAPLSVTVIDRQIHSLALRHERNPHVVEKQLAVIQSQAPHNHLE